MPFFQHPPQLGNQYDDDPLIRDYLAVAGEHEGGRARLLLEPGPLR